MSDDPLTAALWADDRFREAMIRGDDEAVRAEFRRLLDDNPDVQAAFTDEPRA